MRKVQQIKILELLNMLQQAQYELRKISEPNMILSLLADCQELAFQIGQYIENIKGEGTKTVSLLEECCEIIYKASLESNIKGYIKRLKSHLFKIENSVRSELNPSNIEVVFFPYLLSMFDAFESIYMAAKADPNCNVYVVPIPWFDKLPDGSFGKMQYDGDQYPEYINITYWKDYDIEAHHPDVIYIHNPYDESNYITSVHPDYYSKRLRSYTDYLVYIPYFVYSGDLADDYCTAPGCVYAHKVILESEKVREIYIQAFKKNFGSNFSGLDNKFMAIGSPKYDLIHNNKQNDLDIPTNWYELILNEDGMRKKIVLYNTSVGAALRDSAQYLEKLQSVLNIFRRRDDILLWWRPHPLNETMYQSMLPQLLGKYKEIIQEHSNFIFDTSSNLHRAIAMSDCYFGDSHSSLVSLYQATGKPMMTQNVQYDSEKNYIAISCICEYENSYWAVASDCNALLRINKDTFFATYIGSFPNETNTCKFLYTSVAQAGGKLFFAPRWANEIGVYDILNNVFEKISISQYANYEWWTQTPNKFLKVIANNESVYFIGYDCPSIVKYDIKQHKISYLEITCIDLSHIYATQACVVDNKVFIPLRGKDALLVLNMSNDSIDIAYINKTPSGFGGLDGFEDVCYDGTNLWILCLKGRKIVKFNLTTGDGKEIPIITDNSNDSTQSGLYFGYLYLLKNRILVFPSRGNCFAIINCENDEVKCYKDKLNLTIPEKKNITNKITCIEKLNDEIYAFNSIDNCFVKFNIKTERFDMIPVKISSDDVYSKYSIYRLLLTDIDKAYFEKNPILNEDKYCDLSVFLSYVTGENCDSLFDDKRVISPTKTSGQDIYNYVKGLVLP